MTQRPDTLDIGSLRLQDEYPIAQTQVQRAVQDEKDPEAAATARARIAALPDFRPGSGYKLGETDQVAPASPTADLIIDKQVLAAQAYVKPIVRRHKIPSVVLPTLTAIGVFFLVLLLFKAPVIISQAQYNLGHKSQAPATTSSVATEVIPAENSLTINKINVHAPVLYEPSIQEAAIQHALESGVVHYGNTATPDQIGNVAIFGHSSNDWWEPGNYKFVFVLLDKLTPGDQISLDYQSKRYTYEVTGSRVVEPTEVSVLNATASPTLTLITCTPAGTSLRRLVVTAKLTGPAPSGVASTSSTPAPSGPGVLTSSPSFLDQLTQAFTDIFSQVSSLIGGGTKPSPQPTAPGQIPSAK